MKKRTSTPLTGLTAQTSKEIAEAHGHCPKGRDCPSCNHLCQHDSGVLHEDDFAPLAKHLGLTEVKLKMNYLEQVRRFNTTRWKPKLVREDDERPHGRCIFYNEHEKCTVYGVRPLQCRTSTCQSHGKDLSEWTSLNLFVNKDDPVSLREWAVKLRVTEHDTIPGGKLHELVPDEHVLKRVLGYEILTKDQLVKERELARK